MLTARSLLYDTCYCIAGTIGTLGFSLRTEGQEHVPESGPALLVANHQSFVDPLLVGLAARRRLDYLARKTLFRSRILATFLPLVNTVPVDQEGFAREGLLTLIKLLQAGHAVVIFPEGERCWKGHMQPLRPGVHLLIKKAPGPIIPVGIAGAYDSWPRWRKLPIPAPLFLPAGRGCMAVSIGKPLDGKQLADRPREEVLGTLFNAIKGAQERAEKLRRKSL